jgi:hypothetical protein
MIYSWYLNIINYNYNIFENYEINKIIYKYKDKNINIDLNNKDNSIEEINLICNNLNCINVSNDKINLSSSLLTDNIKININDKKMGNNL